jgi:RNA polymerase sigma factor (sigma-70 family)
VSVRIARRALIATGGWFVVIYFTPAGSEFAIAWPGHFPAAKAQPDAIIREPPAKMLREDDAEPSGEELFLAHLDAINKMAAWHCRSHYLRQSDAEDFQSIVYVKLIQNDYEIFREWRRECSLEGYLGFVIGNCFKDFLDKLWGKWRPCEAAKQEGPIAILLDMLTSRDGYTFDEACEILKTNHQVPLSRRELRRIADKLALRTKRKPEGEEVLTELPSPQPRPDQVLIEDERDKQLNELKRALRDIVKKLPAQDALILMLRFWHNQSITAIAGVLHVPREKLFPRVKRLLKHLRDELRQRGFDDGSVPEI